ncbi:MAG: hypothetical protein IJZ22_00155 [Bacteroidaceae bacterium]|nr:hypothetical protein [Bacteroidaceae bacterium]
MKKVLLIVTAVVCMCSTTLYAQEKKQKLTPEQRMDMWVIKMQNKLMLDDATAAKFAPIYKEYLQAMMECCKPAAKKCENLTDEQIKEGIGKRLEARQKALDVEKKYFKKLSSVLNGRQLQQVFCKKDGFSWKKGRKGKWEKRGVNDCPQMQGECPKAKGDCPKVKGQCSKAKNACSQMQHQCPQVKNECPQAKKQCPDASTK